MKSNGDMGKHTRKTPEDNILSPQQQMAWSNYVDPKSKTFSNAYQSAKKAGYSEEYSSNIMIEKWWKNKLRILNMLDKAEQNLSDFLEMDTKTKKLIQNELVEMDDSEKMRIKADITKFVAERVGKARYSTRQELTAANGEPLILPSVIIEKNDTNPSTGDNSTQ